MHFTVAVEQMVPGVFLKENNGSLAAKGPLIDLLQLFSERMHFTYSLKRADDNAWGTETQNGWTGMIGMMLRNEVDFSISPFTLTYERWSLLPTSRPIYVDHVEILLPFREFQLSLFTVLHIYHWNVWLAFLLSIFIVSLVTVSFNRCFSSTTKLHTAILNYLWQAYRTFLLQGYKILHHPSSGVLIFGILLTFLTLIMSLGFSCSLLMTMMVRKVQPIDSLEDLAQTDICPILKSHSAIYFIFENSKLETKSAIFQRAIADPDRNIMNLPKMETIGMDMVESGTHAMLIDRSIIRSMLAHRAREGRACNYRVARNAVFPMFKVLLFRKDFPKDLLLGINDIIRQSSETGLISTRIEAATVGYKYCLENTDTIKSISLDHVKGIFFIWSLGCVLGFLVLIAECYYKKKHLK